MATNKSELLSFEFAMGSRVVGRATWLGPGEVELDFQDQRLRRQFAKFLSEPQVAFGLAFETGGDSKFWPDVSRSHFADACHAMSNLYQVRRVL